jgi:hypothetical protein
MLRAGSLQGARRIFGTESCGAVLIAFAPAIRRLAAAACFMVFAAEIAYSAAVGPT